jgi:hypothetical protein
MIRQALLAAGLLSLVACPSVREEGFPGLPPDLRADYAVFADRCSKCHSLSRPLDSGIVDDEFWVRYVERMRLQPASGISPEDTPAILRFLRFYSAEQRRRKPGALLGDEAGAQRLAGR